MSLLNSVNENVTLRKIGRTACLDIGFDRRVIFPRVDGLPLHDVARLEQAHEILAVADLLIGVVDRHRRDAEHLVAAGAAHRVDRMKQPPCPTVSLGVSVRGRRYFGASAAVSLDHLIEEGQTGDEADHGDEPGRTRMRLNERRRYHRDVDARAYSRSVLLGSWWRSRKRMSVSLSRDRRKAPGSR